MSKERETEKSTPPIPLPQMIAGLALPALGHVLQRRYKHAALFGACVYGLFIGGMAISKMTAIDPGNHDVYWYLQAAVGAPAWIARWGGFVAEPRIGDTVTVQAQMAGVTWLAIAGICNALSVLELAKHNPKERKADAQTTGGAA